MVPAMIARTVAITRTTALPRNSGTAPTASNTKPPTVAPSVIASWTTATISPPPASASSGAARVTHVHQATAAELTKPQSARRAVVTATDVPKPASSMAIIAMIAYGAEPVLRPHLERGALHIVLGEWAPVGSGFHAYYSGRRQVPTALRLLLDLIREMRPLTAIDRQTLSVSA